MKEIAKQSGWSLGTVSRVLRDEPGVNEKARTEVLETARALNYHKNEAASLLRLKQPDGILLVVLADGCSIYAELSTLLEAALREKEKRVTRLVVSADEDEVLKAMAQIRRSLPSLVVFLGVRRENLRRLYGRISVPAISVGASLNDFNDEYLCSCSLPDTELAQQGIEWLFESGKSTIGVLLNDRQKYSELADRFLGVQYAFYSRDQVFSAKTRSVLCPSTVQGGYEGLKQLARQVPDLDGVFVMDQNQAIGALRAAADLGRKVPDDLAVLAMDLRDESKFTIPRLSGCRRNLEEDARTLCQTICRMQSDYEYFMDASRLHLDASWSMQWEESCPRPQSLNEPAVPAAAPQSLESISNQPD